MRLDGAWTAEMAGPHGWENAGTLILDGGHVRGGGNSYYARGTYALTPQGIEMVLTIRFYGVSRTVLGECREEITALLQGSRGENVMYGRMTRKDKPRYSVTVRAVKETSLAKDSHLSSAVIPLGGRTGYTASIGNQGTG